MNIAIFYTNPIAGLIIGLVFTGIVLTGITITSRLLDGGWLNALLSWCLVFVGFIVSMYIASYLFQAPEFSGIAGETNRQDAFYIYFCSGPLLTLLLLMAQKRFRRL